MEHRHSRKRSIAGFTMAEVLVTVGIVAILLAVAVPGVIAARANLKMTELDATAREIFLAAQNSLTGHKAAGTLEQVGALSGGDPRFLRDGESGMDALLPMGAIDPTVAGNHYVVRLNLEYATVLDVFYSEEGFGGDLAGKTNEELYAKLYDDPAARKELQVGYYNGGGTEYNRLEQLLSPAIEVINGDELRVNVTVPDYAQYQDKGVKLTVRVETLDGAEQRDFDLTFETGRASLLLDSLEAGKQFSGLCPGITPGAQIRITATLTAADCLPSTASFETNSLFAGRQGDTALIACGRHLQNLDCGTSGVLGVTAAVQTAEITWPSAFNFIPIESYDLLSYSGNKLPIRDLFINDVQTVKRKSYGLFGDIWYNSSVDPSTKLQISGVRIVNPDIRIGSDDTGTNVGALAGSATDAEITDCLVYLEKAQETADYTDYAISGPGSVGGLIGKASKCTITSSAVGLYSVRGTSDCEYLGGLIGYAEACTITNSYASIDQLGGSASTAVAMFVGQGGGTTISNCYAAGNISANTDGTAINGFMQGGGTTSGESGIRDSYCAVTYYDKDGQPRGADFKINQAFSPAAAGNCAYLETGTAARSETAAATALDYDALREWEGIGGTALAPELSHPYQAELDGKAYPFPALMLSEDNPIPHYGSWPLADDSLLLAYYEIYDGGSSLGLWLNGETSTLVSDPAVVMQDGYALLSPAKRSTLPEITYSVKGTDEKTPVEASGKCVLYGEAPVSFGKEQYYVYLLPAEAIQTTYVSEGFYQKLTCGAQTFWYNPHFAKAIPANQKNPGKPAKTELVSIRSARQLAALGAHSTDGDVKIYQALSYIQELNIDYSKYNGNYLKLSQDCIGTNYSPFTGVYDGKEHEIRALNVPMDIEPWGGYGGLFGVNEGTIKSLSLIPDSLSYYAHSGLHDAGVLVGYNSSGHIQNCSVFLEKDIEVGNPGYWGGLVGINRGSITESFVAGDASVTGSGYVAGFVGWNLGTVSRCYADLTLEGSSTSGFVVLNDAEGENGIINDCYALLKTSSTQGGARFSDKGGGTIDNCYAVVNAQGWKTKCYYLSGGTDTPQAGESKTYGELAALDLDGAWGKKGPGQSHPFDRALNGLAYPFPGLDGLDHYGDWPLEIAVYDKSTEGSPLNVILVPDGGTKNVYVQVLNGSEPVEGLEVYAADGLPIVKSAYDGVTGRTALTLNGKSASTGVTYVDLKCGGTTLRAVVVVYEAKITLSGSNNSNTIESTASSSGDRVIKALTLNQGHPSGTFTATAEVKPSRDALLEQLAVLRSSAPAGTVWSAGPDDLEGWETLKDGDPAVTRNGNPEAGLYILEPADGNYYPTAVEGKLTVKRAATGTATVSARWAMDESLSAACDVKVAGSRIFIREATAHGSGSGKLAGNENYPYRLVLKPQPGDAIQVTLMPQLFGSSGGGTCTWTVYRTDGNVEEQVSSASGSTNYNSGAPYTFTLSKEESGPSATYRVTLNYSNDKGDSSTDYMYLSLYRTTRSGSDIQISGADNDKVSIEQINSESEEFRSANTATLNGYVKGAGNTRVAWSYSTDEGTTWTAITGSQETLDVRNKDGVVRAIASWNADDNTLPDNSNVATGGSVTVTGLDVNEYDKKFEFILRATAVEFGGGNAPCKDIVVSVMPKLRLDPQSKVLMAFWSPPSQVFRANRDDKRWDYIWTVNDASPEAGECTRNIQGEWGTSNIKLQYGPYETTATFRGIWILSSFHSSINWDGEDGYFLLEKGKTRSLEFSWGGTVSYKIDNHPQKSTYVDVEKDGGESERTSSGSYRYNITGLQFTYDKATSLTWKLSSSWASSQSPKNNLHVVGLEITDDTNKNISDHSITLNELNENWQLNDDCSFPKVLTNSSSIIWNSSNEDVIEVDTSGKITAKKYGTATVTATYTVDCTNGRTYIYTDWVNVIVEPSQQLNVTLAPCASSDVAVLNAAFDEHLTGSSLLAAAYSEGKAEHLALVADPVFGCNTLYLKATVTQGASPADLSQYLCHVYSDDFYLETASAPSGGILYIRLQAKEGAAPANPTDLDIRVDIGTVSDSISVRLYDAPSVELYTGKSWSTDATNGSTSVSSTDKAASYTFKAVMTPELHPYGRSAELDSLTWYLEVPPGYEVEDYLTLTPSGDGTATVTVEQFPDFRVVIHAQSTSAHDPDELNDLADAGHALVFLPNDS